MHPLREAWVDLLRPIPFQYFTTLTFDRMRSVHPEAAHKKLQLYHRRANDALLGKGWRRRDAGIGSLIAMEPHADGRTHVHLLQYSPHLQRDDAATRLVLKNLWEAGQYALPNSLREGIARVLPAAGDAAANYCAKRYVIKGGDLWIDDALKEWMVDPARPAPLPLEGCMSRGLCAATSARSST